MDVFVVGAGYVGLTTAIGFANLGHHVTVHDIDPLRVQALSAGQPTIFEPGLPQAMRAGMDADRLRFTSLPSPDDTVELAIVCVPTPTNEDGRLDTTLVEAVVDRLLDELPPSATIVIRSTLPLDGPDRLASLSRGRPRPAIVVNPEFMREGRALADFAAPSRIVVGYLGPSGRPAAEWVAGLYAGLGAPSIVADARSVVMIKLASNVFLGAKIAFVNELARLCDEMGADVSIVADGIGLDPRIGRAFLDPGPGFGGSCLPEQAAAIAVEAAGREVAAPLLSAIALSNEVHEAELVATIGRLLPSGLAGARIALLGLAFKANTDDVRRSPALALARGLRARGATVVGFDPAALETARRADPALETAPSAAAAIDGSDVVVVATEWPEFAALDWPRLATRMRGDLVYDTRRILTPEVVRAAGLRYLALGRPGLTDRAGNGPRTGPRRDRRRRQGVAG